MRDAREVGYLVRAFGPYFPSITLVDADAPNDRFGSTADLKRARLRRLLRSGKRT